MSTAFYPLGMKTYNNHVPQGGYKTWKGTGVFSNPVGVTASHIRPLTNNDSGNVFPTGFGLPRPIKHYRKGRIIPVPDIIVEDPNNPAQYMETSLINYNLNRMVKSSKGASLGGGAGGLGLLGQMMDNPCGYIVKNNISLITQNEYENYSTLQSNWALKYTNTESYIFSSVKMSSLTGQYQIVTTQNANVANVVFISSNFGNNWSQVTLPNLSSSSVSALSADGMYQIILSYTIKDYPTGKNYHYYISSDYGSTWTEKNITLPVSSSWYFNTLTMSSNGKNIVFLASENGPPNQHCYASTDYGNNFTQNPVINFFACVSLGMSEDGNYLTCAGNTSPGAFSNLYTSTDLGATWVLSTTAPIINGGFFGLGVSSTGQYQSVGLYDFVTATNNSFYYSNDYGQTWTVSTNIPNCYVFSMSIGDAGKTQIAILYNDFDISSATTAYIYKSTDYGVSWSIYKTFALSNTILNSSISISSRGNHISVVIGKGDNPPYTNYIFTTYASKETNLIQEECKTCEGVGIVASYYPNTTYLTENPEANTQNQVLCCNAQKKARRRVLPASTKLKKNYYTTHTQYMQNRCQTYEQKAFNFQTPNPVETAAINSGNPNFTAAKFLAAKPGSPLGLLNTYFANCQPNGEIYEATEIGLINKMLSIMGTQNILSPEEISAFQALNDYSFDVLFNYLQGLNNEAAIAFFIDFINNPYYGVPFAGPNNPVGCKVVVYKPNNPQFAKQGSVSSSTRMLKLNVDTIQTNAASLNRNNANLVFGESPETANILKNKAPRCNNPTIIRFQNKKSCYLSPQYNLYGQPTQSAFNTNHFAQSPRNPLM